MTPQVQQALTEARQQLGAMYGDRLRRVVLYGSQARGDDTPDSDVDVLVVLDGPVDVLPEIRRLVRVETKLFERYRLHFSFQPYDVETYEARQRPFIQNVHADAVEL